MKLTSMIQSEILLKLVLNSHNLNPTEDYKNIVMLLESNTMKEMALTFPQFVNYIYFVIIYKRHNFLHLAERRDLNTMYLSLMYKIQHLLLLSCYVCSTQDKTEFLALMKNISTSLIILYRRTYESNH